MMEKSTSRWAILAEIYLCMLAYAVVFQSIPPIISLIIDRFHLSHHEAGLLMSMFALPGVVVSLPAGMLTDRFGIKPIGMITLALTIIGTALVASGGTFGLVLAGRVIAGTGAVKMVIIVPQAVALWFAGREMGVAMGIFNTALPLGTIVSLNALPALASAYGWRMGIWATCGLTVMTLAVFALFYRSPLRQSSERATTARSPWNVAGLGLPIWMIGAAWALFNASIISALTFTPDFLVSSGLRLGSAGFITGLVMAGSFLFSPFIGFLIDKKGGKRAFIAAGSLGMAVLLFVFPVSAAHFAAIMIGVGIMAALIPSPVFSLTADVVSPERLGVGYGIVSLLCNLGTFVGPQAVGFARDALGSYTVGFWIMAFFSFLGMVCIIPLWLGKGHSHA